MIGPDRLDDEYILSLYAEDSSEEVSGSFSPWPAPSEARPPPPQAGPSSSPSVGTYRKPEQTSVNGIQNSFCFSVLEVSCLPAQASILLEAADAHLERLEALVGGGLGEPSVPRWCAHGKGTRCEAAYITFDDAQEIQKALKAAKSPEERAILVCRAFHTTSTSAGSGLFA